MKFIFSLSLIFLSIQLSQAQRILFVGNSLTYTNDVPVMVKNLGKAMGRKLDTECVCYPNYGLEDHWNDGRIQKKIEKGAYDFVLFQQGPSSQAYGRQSLLEYGGKISTLAKEHGTQPVYFMVWPSLQYYRTFAGVIKNHRDAAESNEAIVIPLGELWQQYRASANMPNLYGPDGFHPSSAGSFLAALSIYKTLFPEADLHQISFRKFRSKLNEASFEAFIELVEAR